MCKNARRDEVKLLVNLWKFQYNIYIGKIYADLNQFKSLSHRHIKMKIRTQFILLKLIPFIIKTKVTCVETQNEIFYNEGEVMVNQNTIEESSQYYPNVNIKVKDRLFRFIFRKKEDLLDLYNAVNDSNYCNIEDLEVNTLEDAVYLSMKNDISFLIGGIMNLYEHQSTYNPNMPIRGLMYLMTLYKQHIDLNDVNVYGEKLQILPCPQYIVFYNGTKKQPDKVILKLSDAFEKIEGKEPCIECKAIMLNINYGHNRELMEKCRRLEEYAIFIATVRNHYKECKNVNMAVNLAVDECISKGILKDILIRQRAEVVSMLLTTFNQEVYEKGIRAEGYEDGVLFGSIKTYIESCQEFAVPKESALLRLMEKFSLDQSTAEDYLEKYWN